MLRFKSILSGSSGNCLLVWSEATRVMIDCGIHSIRRCKELLLEHLGPTYSLDALIVSHTHSDHINYSALRFANEFGINVRVHEKCVHQLAEKHFNGYNFSDLRLDTFIGSPFKVGDLVIRPVELRHEPLHPTFGFVIDSVSSSRRIFIATDFTAGNDLPGHLAEADIIFIESNYDMNLLKKHPNYNSKFHMSNPRTAQMLYDMRASRQNAPQTVMLGHLSQQRNTEILATEAVREAFGTFETDIDFELLAAPRYQPSAVMTLDKNF